MYLPRMLYSISESSVGPRGGFLQRPRHEARLTGAGQSRAARRTREAAEGEVTIQVLAAAPGTPAPS